MKFAWDSAKATSNLAKHKIDFREATTVFGDPFARIDEDAKHSFGEERSEIIGFSNRFRLLVVTFTERQGGIRIITARRATNEERNIYENSAF
ncbi:MAG: BrnT family toxin [Ignavibacteriae bacterium]|nr:BrnT family toxin [Ignavibacteriota bacterium]